MDDRGKCVLTDFGQSEIRSEVYRITGKEQYARELLCFPLHSSLTVWSGDI